MQMLGAFGAIALLLASIGIYGVLAYTVARRRAEFGVRAALGATRARLIALTFRDGAVVAGGGLSAGLGGEMLLPLALRSLLFDASPVEPSVLVASIVCATVCLAASAVPAWRAASIDPSEAIRGE